MNAVSLQAAGMNLMRLSAPAAGGFLIAIMGVEAVYFIMTAMYLLAVAALAPVRLLHDVAERAADRAAAARRGGFASMREGLGYIRGDRTILVLLTMSFVISALAMPYMMLLPGFVKENLRRRRGGTGAADRGRRGRLAGRARWCWPRCRRSGAGCCWC